MKRTRKGFTLLELLVVIGVMGILSSTAMIAGQQATDAARATNIADGLEKAASAMMMYYSDNAEDIAMNGIHQSGTKSANAILAEGANAYLKKSSALVEKETEGKYSVAVVNVNAATGSTTLAAAQEWWIVYTLPATDTAGIGPILKNKAKRMELKNAAAGTEEYDGGATVAMKVRGTAQATTTP